MIRIIIYIGFKLRIYKSVTYIHVLVITHFQCTMVYSDNTMFFQEKVFGLKLHWTTLDK